MSLLSNSYYSSSCTDADVPKIVAAGKGKSVRIPVIRDKIISLTNKDAPTILYLGTASFDQKDPYIDQTKGFQDAGCEIIWVNLTKLQKSTNKRKLQMENLREQFDQADAILASGGDTRHALQQWKNMEIDHLIVKAAFRESNPAVLCGGSAGGICWFSYCHIIQKPEDLRKKGLDQIQEHINSSYLHDCNRDDNSTVGNDCIENGFNQEKNEEEPQLEYFRISGMNIVPALCVPHHDVKPSNALPRAEDSNRMTLQYSNIPTIGIDEAAALVLVGSQASVVSGDGKAKCYLKHCIHDNNNIGKRLKITPKHHRDEEFDICDFFYKGNQ